MFRFEKLEVWRVAIELADEVYRRIRDFPAEERFGLTSQVRRSSVSVSANIAEGSGRSTKKDRVRFVEIGYGSLMETVSHLEIAKRQLYLPQDAHAELYDRSDRLARMLSGYRKSLDDK
jgi:four helix bundle protein